MTLGLTTATSRSKYGRHVAVSTGSACASGREKPSHVLEAMGYTPEEAGGALRFSAGWETTEADWQQLLAALVQAHREMQPVRRK